VTYLFFYEKFKNISKIVSFIGWTTCFLWKIQRFLKNDLILQLTHLFFFIKNRKIFQNNFILQVTYLFFYEKFKKLLKWSHSPRDLHVLKFIDFSKWSHSLGDLPVLCETIKYFSKMISFFWWSTLFFVKSLNIFKNSLIPQMTYLFQATCLFENFKDILKVFWSMTI
jgi:hypothetical protein